MNEQLNEKFNESANNVRAIKTAARATCVAQYGEETATFVEGLIDLSFRTGALMAAMSGVPETVQIMTVVLLSDLCAEVAAHRAAALEPPMAPDDFAKHVLAAKAVANQMVEQMEKDAEAAYSRLIVPSHLH